MGLVLSVKRGASVKIGDDVKVTLVRLKGRSCQLCFDAPSNVKILRESICGKEEKSEADRRTDSEAGHGSTEAVCESDQRS